MNDTKEYLFKVLKIPHTSEKTSITVEKHNTIVFKVMKHANKIEIKAALHKLFGVKVNHVNTLIAKEKIKHHKKRTSRYIFWKKAYVTLKKGENLDFINQINSAGK